jgi:SEL1 protein
MEVFLSGPPGGRTLPQTPTRLSDLVGGVYGPGASVASTGANSQKAAIRAGMSRASGETWEDILEYYLVGGPITLDPGCLTPLSVQR